MTAGNKARSTPERPMQRDPNDRKVWDAISGDYFAATKSAKRLKFKKQWLAGLLKMKTS